MLKPTDKERQGGMKDDDGERRRRVCLVVYSIQYREYTVNGMDYTLGIVYCTVHTGTED